MLDFLGNLMSGLFGAASSFSQNDANIYAQQLANQTNLQIAQMNNDYNKAMFEKQLAYNSEMFDKQTLYNDRMFNKQADFSREQLETQNAFNESMMQKANEFQLDMWNKQNEYNSAENQRARLEAAGLNPFLMMSGGSAGTAGFASGTSASSSSGAGMPSSGSVSPLGVNAPSASPVHVNPVLSDLSGVRESIYQTIGNIMQAERNDAQNELTLAEAQQVRIENSFKAQNLIADIAEKMSRTESNKLKNAYQSVINDFAAENQVQDLKQKRINYQLSEVQHGLNSVEYSMQVLRAQRYPEQLALDISQSYANLELLYQKGKLNDKELQMRTLQLVEQQAKNFGMKINNWVANRTAQSLVQQAQWNAVKAKNNSNADNPWQDSYSSSSGWLYRGLKKAKEFVSPW